MKIILIKDQRTKVEYWEIIGRTYKHKKFPMVKKVYLWEPITQQYKWTQSILLEIAKNKNYVLVEIAKRNPELEKQGST